MYKILKITGENLFAKGAMATNAMFRLRSYRSNITILRNCLSTKALKNDNPEDNDSFNKNFIMPELRQKLSTASV